MTYNEFIQNILDTRGRFGIPKGEYKERHHIIPKCIGGTNDEDNLIDLYAREHYEAHKLLAIENSTVPGLIFAWHLMHNTIEGVNISADEYELLAKAKHDIKSQMWSGDKNPSHKLKGKKIVWSQSHRENMIKYLKSRDISGDKNPNYGNYWTDEQKAALSKKLKGKPSPNKGKKMSSEQRDLLVENNPSRMPVICLETGLCYRSIKEAARKTGLDRGSITRVCNHKQKKTKNTTWIFLEEYNNLHE